MCFLVSLFITLSGSAQGRTYCAGRIDARTGRGKKYSISNGG